MNPAVATDAASELRAATPDEQASSVFWPLAAIGLVLVFQLTMVFTRAINWDEFWFYYHVTEFARGNLAEPLQSLHVRLFAWLPAMPGDTLDKIITARLFMLACEAVTMGAIYAIARHFAHKPEAAIAALLYVTAGFVFQHGFSFRTDPMATAGLMSALAILLRSKLDTKALFAFALLVAVAGMVTMKIVLYAPAFMGIAWMRWSESGFRTTTALRLILAAAGTIAAFAALYMWHSQALTQTTSGAGMAASASRWMFFLGVPPYWHMIVKSAAFSPVLVIMIVLALPQIWKSDLATGAKIALTGLWLPVLIPAFYTNTAGYFYVFMLAPVSASCVLAIRHATQRYTPKMIAVVLMFLAGGIFMLEDRAVIDRQRAITATAEEVFPHGIAYFDHNGMLPVFDKANYLITPSALQAYRETGVASYRAEMERRPVPLLVANDFTISDMLSGDDDVLLPEDAAALRSTYIPFWGPFHLAGAEVPGGSQIAHDFLVPGTYTIDQGPALIDGEPHETGSLVEISRGVHAITAPEGDIRLLWGERLEAPGAEWDEGDIYVDF